MSCFKNKKTCAPLLSPHLLDFSIFNFDEYFCHQFLSPVFLIIQDVKVRVIFTFVAIVGDITPSDCVPKQEKSRMEQEALDEMCKVLGGGMRGLTKA